jgi:hypothetical protein
MVEVDVAVAPRHLGEWMMMPCFGDDVSRVSSHETVSYIL